MMAKMSGLSRDLIIHPGETLSEILFDRGMTTGDLALMTDVPENHISSVSSGCERITNGFARKLEKALKIDSSFWINLQSNYDNELAEYNRGTQLYCGRAIAE